MGTQDPKTKEAFSARLQRAAAELRELEKLINSTDIDSRVVEEFRGAVDCIRLAAWGIRLQSNPGR